ncbi:MAG: hypothetical protein AAB367_04090 [Patescibacteria group bacterium]
MALDDLRRRLFKKGEGFEDREHSWRLRRNNAQAPVSWKEEPVTAEDSMQKFLRKLLWWGIGGGLGVIALVVLGYFVISGKFAVLGIDSRKNILLTVESADEAIAGKKLVWRVVYENKNDIALDKAVLVFTYPPMTQPLAGDYMKGGLRPERRELGTINPGDKKEELFSAIVFGAQDEILKGQAKIEYRPRDSSVLLAKETSYQSPVKGSLLGLELILPKELKAGQQIDAQLSLVSSAETPFRGISVEMMYPDAFEFISSDIKPTRGNTIWTIGDLGKGETFKLSIKGRIKDSIAPQSMKAKVGIYDRTKNEFDTLTSSEKTFAITPPLLVTKLVIDSADDLDIGVLLAGTSVKGILQWQNNLPVAVSNATVEVVFEGEAFDIKTLSSSRGEFDQSRNALRWVPGRIPELLVVDPGETGTFEFTIATKKIISVRNPALVFKSIMQTRESPSGYEGVDISGEEVVTYKLATRATFSQKGYYYDSRITNSGPLPPRVGQETTYLIVWSVTNATNDLTDAVVHATLPSYVKWRGVVDPPSGAPITFNEATREVSWIPGNIPAGTGTTNRAREVAFQIALTPSLPQVGQAVELVSAAKFEGRDSFADITITQISDRTTTSLRDDPRASREGGSVEE